MKLGNYQTAYLRNFQLMLTVVAVQLKAFNHCIQKRVDLQAALAARDLAERVRIPEDGATLTFTRR